MEHAQVIPAPLNIDDEVRAHIERAQLEIRAAMQLTLDASMQQHMGGHPDGPRGVPPGGTSLPKVRAILGRVDADLAGACYSVALLQGSIRRAVKDAMRDAERARTSE